MACLGWACKLSSERTGSSKSTTAEDLLPAGEGATGFHSSHNNKGKHTNNQLLDSLDLKSISKGRYVHAEVTKMTEEHSD